MKIAIVVQRYGLEVNGGAELYARLLAEHLPKNYEIHILTTTAVDYLTWKPHYKEGQEEINGITVHRFDVDKTRNMTLFSLLYKFVFYVAHPHFIEKFWLDQQGPHCPKLLGFIEESKDKYDIFIFFTFLYSPAVYGLPIVKNKAILVPTAHDDHTVRLNIYKNLFQSSSGLVYSTIEEKTLTEKLFSLDKIPSIIAGIGIDMPDKIHENMIFKDYPHLKDKPYILYVGRISAPKGADILIDHFLKFRTKTGRDINLVMLGKKDKEIREDPSIITPGFVSEEMKYSFIKNASLLVNPSRFESLSIVLLESWFMEVPVLVNAECEVLENQVKRSKGGKTFKDYDSFEKGLLEILDNPEEAEIMAKSGRKYFDENYTWEIILQKWCSFIEKIAANN